MNSKLSKRSRVFFIKLMLVVLSIAVITMIIDIGKNGIKWYKWRSQGTQPKVIVGELVKLVKLVKLEGKKAGRQILHISSTEKDIELFARLSKTQQQVIATVNHRVNISFIPSPFGNPYVSKLSSIDNKLTYYQKNIKTSIWFGIVAFIVWLVMSMIFCCSIYFIFKQNNLDSQT